jgi:hypothetical protein
VKLGRDNKEFYALTHRYSGEILAYITVSEYGRAIVKPYYSNPEWPQPQDTSEFGNRGKLPMFNIGRQDLPLLEQAMENKTTVRYSFKAKFVPRVKSMSIAGTFPGLSKEEILILGHADTPYNSPGANDNTATVICMIMLAHSLSGTIPKKTVTFLATSGEEYGKLGAIHYKESREKAGTLNNIRMAIELDSLTWGNDLQLYSSHSRFTELIAECNNDLKIDGIPKIVNEDSGGDSRPFRQTGIPTVFVNTRGENYNDKTLKLWHRPEDRPDGVHPELVENGFLVFQEVIKRLQQMDL